MPLYEYKCPMCALVFDIKRSFADFAKALPCPECGEYAQVVIQPNPIKLGWVTPTHNKDPFDPLPAGYTPGNLRTI